LILIDEEYLRDYDNGKIPQMDYASNKRQKIAKDVTENTNLAINDQFGYDCSCDYCNYTYINIFNSVKTT